MAAALGHSTPAITAKHYAHFVRKTFASGMLAPLERPPTSPVAAPTPELALSPPILEAARYRRGGTPPRARSSGAPGRPTVATPGGCGGRLLAGFRCGDLRATPKGSPSRRRWTSMPDGQLRTLCDACHPRARANSGAAGPAEKAHGNDDQGDREAVA